MAAEKEPINLVKGQPNTSLLPTDLLLRGAKSVLSDPTKARDGLLYGPDAGYEPLREAISDWLNNFYDESKVKMSAERICITGGASQNMGCLLNTYTDPEYTRNVWIVAPAYFLAFRIFEDAGFGKKMRAVPEDEEGVDLAFLRAEIAKSEEAAKAKGNSSPLYKRDRPWARVYKHIIYCVPTFSNPTSRTMTLGRRKELVRIARQYDALVVADDVYDMLQWYAHDSDPLRRASFSQHFAFLPRLVDLDGELDGGPERDGAHGFGNVCSNATFSKLAGPGLRVGWVEGTAKFAYGVSQTGTQRSGGAPSQLTSTYVTTLLTSGQLQSWIRIKLLPAYTSRYACMMKAVEEHLRPMGFTLPQPGRDIVGGYFVWLGLPAGLIADQLAEDCVISENLLIAAGTKFEVPGDNDRIHFWSSIRLCFAWEDEWKLTEGVKRVANSAQKLLNRQYVIVDHEPSTLSELDAKK